MEELGFSASEPVWSRTVSTLIMSANRHDNYELEPRNTEVYEFRVSDGATKALTSRPTVRTERRRFRRTGTGSPYTRV